MDYDDELRRSCEKTGDLLHKRKKNDKCFDGEMDEFEAEMETELDEIYTNATSNWIGTDENQPGPSGSSAEKPDQPGENYDKDYFDSSDEEESSKKHTRLTNDELLYDPDADEQDQKWMDQRNPVQKKEGSDAVLNCPACLTVICVDCQRHETYHTQYRAMFYMNCTVDTENVLRYKRKNKKQKRGRKGKKERRRSRSRSRSKSLGRVSDATASDVEDLYHPVKCNICDTEVGVFDSDEIVHFFNVIASHK